ncbi:uncharacterized protein BKA55DRAFT_743565 [Fusarium redolens]|uniref:Uncharacterized protein n=1 Tax=Fusarium redolens TaxID=48865 RepID=A0A9P9FZM5_FUSRE|nr:uncharacterized protein BKA55DRAFT_743565 [Fusarium redolens]KAH7227121.1 hypothetical protein BKA55DRAFT_743565 [Fusarium redolens]
MKFQAILALLAVTGAVASPVSDKDLQLEKRASCNVCVTTVKGNSETIWGRGIPYEQGGLTTRNVYIGCDALIDRKRSTRCSDWSVWTRGDCGRVTKQQPC